MNSTVLLAETKPGEENPDDDLPIEVTLLAAGEGVPELGLTAEFLERFKKDLALLADVVKESRIAQETEEAALHEANRDKLVVYITTRISSADTLLLEAEREAGKYLYKVVKPYIGIARLPVAQETAAIQGMLIDLRKEENAPYVTTLGLDAYLEELEKENDAYRDLTLARTQSRAANKKESGAEIRKRLNEQYDDLVMLAQSYNVVQPTERSTAFINNLNQLISETVAAYNQRKASRKQTEEENDTAETL